MRDLAILLILASCVWISWRRPWLGVLALSVVGYLAPQGYAVDSMKSFPAFLVVFLGLLAGTSRAWWRGEIRPRLPQDWSLWLILVLWGWFIVTTYHAMAPFAAWPRLFEVSKSLVPLLFTLLLIDHRNKLYLLIMTIALAFALVTLKGAYWTLSHGFTDRIYGPPGSHFYDNNLFAIAVLTTLPLLYLCWHEARQRTLRHLFMLLMLLSVVAALSSWSRGALITLVVTLALLVLGARKKQMALILVLVGGVTAGLLLPEQWFTRMETTVAYQGEASAENRLAVWKTGYYSIFIRPFTGSGFEGWRFSNQSNLDWHNSYVEVLAEHGPIGLTLWLGVLAGAIYRLGRLSRLCAVTPHLSWVRPYSTSLRAALVAYACGGMFIGISYWDLYFHLVVITIVLGSLVRQELSMADFSLLGPVERQVVSRAGGLS